MTDHEELAKRARDVFRDHVAENGTADVASAWLAVARALVPEGWAVVKLAPPLIFDWGNLAEALPSNTIISAPAEPPPPPRDAGVW